MLIMLFLCNKEWRTLRTILHYGHIHIPEKSLKIPKMHDSGKSISNMIGLTMDIAAWVSCKTSKQATIWPSVWEVALVNWRQRDFLPTIINITYLYPALEDARIFHHALYAVHQELLYPPSQIQGFQSLPIK